MIILLPLVAFIEEFAFRSLLLSILVSYFQWELIIAILFISFVFGISHFSTSKNWGHFISTTLSSIIYFAQYVVLAVDDQQKTENLQQLEVSLKESQEELKENAKQAIVEVKENLKEEINTLSDQIKGQRRTRRSLEQKIIYYNNLRDITDKIQNLSLNEIC